MPKSKIAKQGIVERLAEKFSKSEALVFAGHTKLTVAESETLRKSVKAEQGEMVVAKKTLFERALKDAGFEHSLVRKGEGQVLAVIAYQDQAAPVKIVDGFKKANPEKISYLFGFLDRALIDSAGVASLASLPSRLELYAKALGSMTAPLSGLVGVCSGPARSLVYALKAVSEKKN